MCINMDVLHNIRVFSSQMYLKYAWYESCLICCLSDKRMNLGLATWHVPHLHLLHAFNESILLKIVVNCACLKIRYIPTLHSCNVAHGIVHVVGKLPCSSIKLVDCTLLFACVCVGLLSQHREPSNCTCILIFSLWRIAVRVHFWRLINTAWNVNSIWIELITNGMMIMQNHRITPSLGCWVNFVQWQRIVFIRMQIHCISIC